MQEDNKTAAFYLIILFKISCISMTHVMYLNNSSNKLMQSKLTLRKRLGEDHTLERSPNFSRKQLHICQQAPATKIAIAIKATNLQNLINTSVSIHICH